MQDSIIKGTGNSRYLKSVAAFLTQYPTYADFAAALAAGTLPVELNGINEEGFQQLGTALNKENLLRDNTAALYGLGTDAVPDDVFAWLGKYNQYWWKKRVYVEATGYEEKQTVATDAVNLLYANDSTTTNTILYSDSISINQSTGTVSLKNLSTVTLSFNKYTRRELISLFAGKYIRGVEGSSSTIYLVGTKIGQSPTGTNGDLQQEFDPDSETGRFIRITYPGLKVITSQKVDTSIIGDWSYLQSSNRNAYPDSGIVDGYEYMYLGKPYENFIEVPVEIEALSYTGTGTYGTANKNTLTFSKTPKIVFIHDAITSLGIFIKDLGRAITTTGISTSSTDTTFNYGQSVAWVENSLIWYNNHSGSSQLNKSGTTYLVIAIC